MLCILLGLLDVHNLCKVWGGQLVRWFVNLRNFVPVRLNGGKKLNNKYLRRQLKEYGLSYTIATALNPHLGIYKNLAESISTGKEPLADSYAGYSSVDTLMGIYKSAKTGDTVALPLTEDFASTDMADYEL